MKLLLRWLVSALTLILLAYYLPGVRVDGGYTAIVVVLVLSLLNAVIRPILIVLTLPVNLLTLGLFSLVINALIFWLASTMVKGFYVEGFTAAFFGALIMSVVSWFTSLFLKR